MHNTSRKHLSRIEHLQQRHTDLKRRIAALDRQRHLSPEQQILVTSLKKQRLAAKDALAGMQPR